MKYLSVLFLFLFFWNPQEQIEDSNCWQNVSNHSMVKAKRGNACNNSKSLKVYVTNNYNYKITAAFYFKDKNGNFNKKPTKLAISSKSTANHHICEANSNGDYYVFIKRFDEDCGEVPRVQ